MHFGRQQVAKYGLESIYGVGVTPAYWLGIVVSGDLTEGVDVYDHYGPESRWSVAKE